MIKDRAPPSLRCVFSLRSGPRHRRCTHDGGRSDSCHGCQCRRCCGQHLAVAIIAWLALRRTSQDTFRLEKAAAEQAARTARVRSAELDRQQVLALARLHGTQDQPHVVLNPLERGEIRTALDALPQDRLTVTREWFDGGLSGDRAEDWRRVRCELSDELRRLTEVASSGGNRRSHSRSRCWSAECPRGSGSDCGFGRDVESRCSRQPTFRSSMSWLKSPS